MTDPTQTRAPARGLTAAAAFGSVVGLAIGAAYLGGTVAKATVVRVQAERIEGVRDAGYTEEALVAAAGGLNASALTIARRHDPYTVAGDAQRDRQAAMLAARLERMREAGGVRGENLRQVSFSSGDGGARPFNLGGALDASRDLECLTQAVYYEARGEGRAGMQAVAQVVLNRARHGAFPRTVCGVVYQGASRRTGCQFSFTCNGAMRRGVNGAAWSRARDIASRALSGEVYSAVGTATHFHTTGVSPRWRHSLVRVNQVGTHIFYRFGGRSGSSSAFAYDARPSSAADIARPVHASLDPGQTMRQAGEAVAYTLLLAQEGREAPAPAPMAEVRAESAPQPVAQPQAAPAASRIVQPAPVRPPEPAAQPVIKPAGSET